MFINVYYKFIYVFYGQIVGKLLSLCQNIAMTYTISIVLDKRRIKSNDKYPLKLRVFSRQLKKDKRYPIDIDLSEAEFNEIWINTENKKIRGAKKELELQLKAIETRANEEAKQLTVFTFEKFETRLFRKSSDKNSIKYYFETIIENKIKSFRQLSVNQYTAKNDQREGQYILLIRTEI